MLGGGSAWSSTEKLQSYLREFDMKYARCERQCLTADSPDCSGSGLSYLKHPDCVRLWYCAVSCGVATGLKNSLITDLGEREQEE